MAPEIRDALAGLCQSHGWSYGVIWRVDRRDPRLLAVEDSYCKEEVRVFVEHLIDRVHVVGKGILGVAALNDKHEWIYHDTDSNLETNTGDPEGTIAIVSLPSFGVAQFGSPEKVPESLEFVDQAKCLLQLICQKDLKFIGHHASLACTSSSGDAYFFSGSTKSSNERMVNPESIRGKDHASNIFSQLSFVDLRHPDKTMSPYPVTSSSTDTSRGVSHQCEETPFRSWSSIFQFKNQLNTAGVEAGCLLQPLTRMLANSDCPDGSIVAQHNRNNWNKGVNLPMTGKEMLSVWDLEGLPNLVPMNSNFSVAQPSVLSQLSAGSSSNQFGLQSTVLETRSMMASKACLPSAVTFSDPDNGITDHLIPPIAAELLNNSFTMPQVLPPESSVLAHKVDQADNLINLCDKKPKQVNGNRNESLAVITDFIETEANGSNMTADISGTQVDNTATTVVTPLNQEISWKENSNTSNQLIEGNDFFDGLDLDHISKNFVQEYWDDILMPCSESNLSINLSEGISELNTSPLAVADKAQFAVADKAQFLGSDLEQLLDAIVGENVSQSSSQDSIDKTARPFSGLKMEQQLYAIPGLSGPSLYNNHVSSACLSSINHKPNALYPHCNLEGIRGTPQSLIKSSGSSSWFDDSCSMNTDNSIHNQQKGEENVKVVKKRARPGESTRPRPKDRQQIQDRVKELREIVPNAAKCSIDALLDRTIKHMLFLQSVTKYADKLKQSDEPKMIVEESGVVLKENFGSGSGGGGATWAYEVAGQTMVCPIIVEDLTPPGQMLVEMLCEDRGFFLEIADIIRGFGLTILKGVMEVRECKIWARFIVEANRDVTRMDIFLSLVQLLQQTSSFRSSEQASKLIEYGTSVFNNYQQSPMSIPISASKTAVI